MKQPLHYQISEYDCGPTSMLNALSYLFRREELLPEIVRNVTLYCLDSFGADGTSGKSGTSRMAMMFLSNWLTGVGEAGHLPIACRQITGQEVNFRQNGAIRDTLIRRGAVVALVDLEGWHYVLLTGIRGDQVYLFDPYYRGEPFPEGDIQMVTEHPDAYNRIVPVHYLERESQELYALGPVEHREAVLLFNQTTRLTEEDTVEYMI